MLYIGRLWLFSVYKWALNLGFSKLGNNNGGVQESKGLGMKICRKRRNVGLRNRVTKIRSTAKFCRGCENSQPCEILQGLGKFATIVKFCKGCENS